MQETGEIALVDELKAAQVNPAIICAFTMKIITRKYFHTDQMVGESNW